MVTGCDYCKKNFYVHEMEIWFDKDGNLQSCCKECKRKIDEEDPNNLMGV